MKNYFLMAIVLGLLLVPQTVEARNYHHHHYDNHRNNDFAVGALSGAVVGTMMGYGLAQPRYERVYPYYVPMQTRQHICQTFSESIIINGFYYEYPRTACLNDYNEWIVVR